MAAGAGLARATPAPAPPVRPRRVELLELLAARGGTGWTDSRHATASAAESRSARSAASPNRSKTSIARLAALPQRVVAVAAPRIAADHGFVVRTTAPQLRQRRAADVVPQLPLPAERARRRSIRRSPRRGGRGIGRLRSMQPTAATVAMTASDRAMRVNIVIVTSSVSATARPPLRSSPSSPAPRAPCRRRPPTPALRPPSCRPAARRG